MSPAPVGSPPQWELRAQVPPGWIELVAHADDDAALAAFDEILEPHRDSLSAAETARLRRDFARARRLSLGAHLRIGGAVLTRWENVPLTVWYYGIWTLGMTELDGVSPVGLLERGLWRALGSDQSPLSWMLADPRQEDFTMVDGRIGSSLHATLRGDLLSIPPDAGEVRAPAEMGLVLAAVPLPGLPDAAALVVGISPTLDQRAAMSVFASVMAHSVHVLGEDVIDVPVFDRTLEEAFGGGRSAGTAP